MRKEGAGKLRNPIMIENFTESRNDFGESLKAWKFLKKCWAEIKPISGKEFFEASKDTAAISHRVIIRYDKAILPSMRIKHRDRVFSIASVRDFFERTRYLELMCEEIVL